MRRKNFTFLKSILVVILSIGLSVSSALAQAQSTYTVKSGDTLYNISKRLNVTIAELKQWNNLTGNDIELGQQLVYYQAEDTEMETDSLPTEPSDPLINRNTQSQTEFYIVKSGDTLYDIARNHDMSVSQLQQLNNLTGSNISIGQRLAVKKQTSTVAPNVARFQEESSPQGVFSVYEIPSGETKEMLLSKFKMTETELTRLNPELDIERLISGQEITVLLPPSRHYENPYLQKASLQDLGQVNVTQYSDQKVGATTTTGELYDPEMLTAAHSNIALGSIIFVENPVTGNGVYVKINDRITESGIKLSKKAYEVLNLKETGEPAVSIYTESND